MRGKAEGSKRRGRPRISVIDRFWRRIESDENGCWVWAGTRNGRGYGRFHVDTYKTAVNAHRFSYELHRGPIPQGLQIDHVCQNKACVNPHHLEPVTHAENQRRRRRDPDGPAKVFTVQFRAIGPRGERCLRGHLFDEENTRVRGNLRICRACVRLRKKAYKRGEKILHKGA